MRRKRENARGPVCGFLVNILIMSHRNGKGKGNNGAGQAGLLPAALNEPYDEYHDHGNTGEGIKHKACGSIAEFIDEKFPVGDETPIQNETVGEQKPQFVPGKQEAEGIQDYENEHLRERDSKKLGAREEFLDALHEMHTILSAALPETLTLLISAAVRS
ncbi:MAG TPA: hypothetical protein VF790_05905 [Dissulfurispiraceae bacterium]